MTAKRMWRIAVIAPLATVLFGSCTDGPTEISSDACDPTTIASGNPTQGAKSTHACLNLFYAPGSEFEPSRETWVVIHGRDNSSSTPEMIRLAFAIRVARPGDQVLLLDWSEAASTSWFGDIDGENWIITVGRWASATLRTLAIDDTSLNLVGHSWGSYVADELAEAYGGVNVIVALDPAAKLSTYDSNDRAVVNFSSHARFSVAFHSSKAAGSEDAAASAHEAFSVAFLPNEEGSLADMVRHSMVRDLFSATLLGDGGVSRLFSLDRLLNASPAGPWQSNRYDVDDAYFPPGLIRSEDYEALMFSSSDDSAPDSIRYIDASGVEQTLREAKKDPDLRVISVIGQPSPVGQPVSVSTVIMNSGAGNADASTLRFILGGRQDMSGTNYLLCDRTVTAHASGQLLGVQATCTIPNTVPIGNYFVHAQVDANDAVSETSEQNNVGVSAVAYSVSATLTPAVVTSGAGLAGSMVISGLSLYGFGNVACFNVCVAAGISRVDLEAGTVKTLFPLVQNNSGIINAVRLLTDGSYVYWLDGYSSGVGARIRRVSVDGGGVDSLAGGIGEPGESFAADDTHLYFASQNGSDASTWAIKRVPKGGGQVETIVGATPRTGFAVDGGYVYYQLRLAGELRRIPVGGGSATIVASGALLAEGARSQLYVADGMLYYSDFESVRAVPTVGGILTPIAAEPGASNMISDGRALYLRNGAGEVVRFTLPDYSRSVVAASAAEGPAVDEAYIYWSTYDGISAGNIYGSKILRIRK